MPSGVRSFAARALLLAAPVALFPGCAPLSPEVVIRIQQRAYEQAEREAEFFHDKRLCLEYGGFVVIERMGNATRRDVVRRVPGDRDTWYCRM